MPTEPYIGQIMAFGGNFAPQGWALCDGSLLPISQYDALFSLIGNFQMNYEHRRDFLMSALQQISAATGGTSYIANTPQDIERILVEALLARRVAPA